MVLAAGLGPILLVRMEGRWFRHSASTQEQLPTPFGSSNKAALYLAGTLVIHLKVTRVVPYTGLSVKSISVTRRTLTIPFP